MQIAMMQMRQRRRIILVCRRGPIALRCDVCSPIGFKLPMCPSSDRRQLWDVIRAHSDPSW